MPNRLVDITGNKYGLLTVLRRWPENNSQGKPMWECQCDCGNIHIVAGSHLKSGRVKSCGCWHKIYKGDKHHAWNGVGDISGGWWQSHIANKTNGNRRKGIKIFLTKEDAWKQYKKQNGKCALSGIELKISMNTNENTASIDRIDNSGDYTPDNIQWVHKHINYMKWIHDQDYFIGLCELVANHAKN